jgi:NAD(P)-dependent dehydrogenase (short-subunit alcohol dehydrogenase family)
LLAKDGYRVALASRDPAKLAGLAAETKAATLSCDAVDPVSVDQLFANIDRQFSKLDVCLFNASARAPGPITDVDREQARCAVDISLRRLPRRASSRSAHASAGGRHDPADGRLG